ncbi:MAG: rod shape-determining protein MreD [Acutalibacteraceae bacterium]|nr:rod shape-determining protein MreD [Acutalibacteraceae bacterium]
MTDRKKVLTLRIINAVFFIILILFQYNTVFEIKIRNATPLLPLALIVACCMFSSELTAAFTGLTVGVFLDCVSSTPQGFNAIIFMVTALAVSLIAKHLFNNNIFAAFTLCFLCSVFYFLTRWIFCFAFSLSLSENLNYLMRFALPGSLYTSVFIIPLYYLEKALYNKFYFIYKK